MNKNRVRLNICGVECVVTSDEPESYMRGLGTEVQKAMAGMIDRNERVSVTMAAIITSLDFCDQSHKAAQAADNLRSQIKDYLEDSSRARMEADESRKEIERMKKEIQTLRARLSGEAPEQAPTEAKSRPATPNSPVQRAPAGSYNHPEQDGERDENGFMSFFEKKTDD